MNRFLLPLCLLRYKFVSADNDVIFLLKKKVILQSRRIIFLHVFFMRQPINFIRFITHDIGNIKSDKRPVYQKQYHANSNKST